MLISKSNAKKNKNIFAQRLDLFTRHSFVAQCTLAGIINLTMTRADKINEIAFSLGVNARTVQRWIAHSAVHPSATRLLFNMSAGISQNGHWAGWRVLSNELISPSNESVNPDILGRLWLWRNERDNKTRKIASLESQISTLENADKYINLDIDIDIDAIKAAASSLNALLLVGSEQPTKQSA
jgi:hypothetical protein